MKVQNKNPYNNKKINKPKKAKSIDKKRTQNKSKNVKEIEISRENIRVIKPEKITNIQKNKGAAKKAAPRKKKKENKKISKIIRGTSILILVIGVIIFICTTPMFNIKNIQVSGNSKLTEKEIQSLSQIKKDDNIFKYSKKNISELILENPYIKSVQVNKKYPDTIELIIEERKEIACVRILNSFAYIDNEGYILEISEDKKGLTIIEGISTKEVDIKEGARLVEQDLESLGTVLKIIETCKSKDIGENINSINIRDEEFVIYLENQRKLIYLGNANNLTYRIDLVKEALKQITEKEGRLYAHGDLNSGFELYFKEGQIINE